MFIAILNQKSNIEDRLSGITAYIPSIVLGELYFGALNSVKPEQNIDNIHTLIADYAVSGCDQVAALYYGQIKWELRSKGRPIPENDIWIVAIARQYELTLVTRDEHFTVIDQLELIRW